MVISVGSLPRSRVLCHRVGVFLVVIDTDSFAKWWNQCLLSLAACEMACTLSDACVPGLGWRSLIPSGFIPLILCIWGQRLFWEKGPA